MLPHCGVNATRKWNPGRASMAFACGKYPAPVMTQHLRLRLSVAALFLVGIFYAAWCK